MKIQESAENYLETILVISKRKPQVRSIDIANELSFSKPSVSVAMKNLRLNGYINVNQEGYITLTESGLAIAEKIYERHELLSTWLIKLGVALKQLLRMPAVWNMSSVQKAFLQLNNIHKAWQKDIKMKIK